MNYNNNLHEASNNLYVQSSYAVSETFTVKILYRFQEEMMVQEPK